MAQYINRVCKSDGTEYHDPGGEVGDPKRYCPTCGSKAWYAPIASEGPEDDHPAGAVEIAELLGVKAATVHMWHYRGIMPTPRWTVSGKAAWRQDDVLAWAEKTGRRWRR